jgi:hypothetical protein
MVVDHCFPPSRPRVYEVGCSVHRIYKMEHLPGFFQNFSSIFFSESAQKRKVKTPLHFEVLYLTI